MTYFYAQLFAMDTEIRAMFPAAMDVQRRRFFEALGRIAGAQQSQADRDRLVPYLQELGRAHRKFGVRERHYEVIRRALLATLQRFAAPRWNETAKHAWEMELAYPWLQVIAAVSDEPAHDHDIMYGTIPELAAKATWAERDVYVSGPDHMIVKTARVLRERGAPSRLIHYDLGPKASQGL
jgi:hemoglobin-like flavoprotein